MGAPYIYDISRLRVKAFLYKPQRHEDKGGVLRTLLFWEVTQRMLVSVYRLFGAAYQSHLQVLIL